MLAGSVICAEPRPSIFSSYVVRLSSSLLPNLQAPLNPKMQLSKLDFVVLTLLGVTRAAAPELEYLTATAVMSDDNGDAKIQCWQFTKELTIYPTIGKVLPFGEVSNLSYVVLPPGSAEGIHKPPHPMHVYFLL